MYENKLSNKIPQRLSSPPALTVDDDRKISQGWLIGYRYVNGSWYKQVEAPSAAKRAEAEFRQLDAELRARGVL